MPASLVSALRAAIAEKFYKIGRDARAVGYQSRQPCESAQTFDVEDERFDSLGAQSASVVRHRCLVAKDDLGARIDD